MSDLKAKFTEDRQFDLEIARNDLALDDGLETAVLVSLFTDRRAEATDQLPAGETSLRGSWVDAFPTTPGDYLGSRLWLLGREKQLPEVLERAREYAAEALRWLVEDRIAARVEVETEGVSPGVLGIRVQIFKPSSDVVNYRYELAWAAQALNV